MRKMITRRMKNKMVHGDFFIALLVRGEAGEYHTEIVKNISEKFNEKYLIENPRPSHFTLKSPFWADDVTVIEDILEDFASIQNAQKISLGGFGSFKDKVVFLNSKFSEEAMRIQKELIGELKEIRGFPLDRHDLEFTPHLTVGYGNTPESFKGIIEYLKSLPEKKFDIKFDNIALLKKNKNVWEVYKLYEIK